MADIAHDLAVEVGLGFEDAACNEVSLDLGEPDLDLIEPRGIGRGVMEFDVGMGAQKALNGCSFMSGKVVSYDMNVGFGGLGSDTSARNSTNSALVWRSAVLARTWPVAVFRAA